MERKDMIDWLVENELGYIFENHPHQYLGDIFRKGHKGFDSYTDHELAQEIRERDPDGMTHTLEDQ